MAALLAVLAVLTVRGRLDAPDMWWHLKYGQVICATHAAPSTDLYSYTASHHQVVPQEWLSEVTIYAAYRLGGYSGLMGWLCFFSAILLIAGYVLCGKYSGNAKIGFVGALVIWFFATAGLAVRGQVIGYLLLIIELLLLHLGRSRKPRWFLAIPLLMLLWVNCHASFFLGLMVLGVYLLCSFFNFRAGNLVCLSERHHRRMLLWASLLSFAATFLNPGGWQQVLYPIATMRRLPVSLANVGEWQPLLLSEPRGAALFLVLLGIFIVLIVRRSEVLYLHELLLLSAGTWLALSHKRMAFVFGILAAPVLTRLLAPLWDRYEPEKDRIAPNAVLLVLAAIVIVIGFPGRATLEKQVSENSPVRAVAYIQSHRLSGNMLNAYTYGGYLIWALPEHPVFIDGRADLYEWAGVMQPFAQWALLETNPNTLLDKYNVSFCLLERGSQIAQVMPLLPNWKQVYSDQQSVIFVRSSPAPGPNSLMPKTLSRASLESPAH